MKQNDQQIRFCTSTDGASIAYATVGSGPPLVKAANWLSHLEFDWQSPVWRHWLKELSRYQTLVRYDERGCGLSGWNVEDFTLDAWVRDLEAVVDSLKLERFPLFGMSQGGPIAIAYAARHPEKVSHLILYGSYARGRGHRGLSKEEMEERELTIRLIKVGWGKEHPAFRQVFTSLFIPEGTPEQLHWFNELLRITTPTENAARIIRGFDQIDVCELAAKLDVPTLVLHAQNDLRVPFGEGRYLASLIPGARFIPLEGKNHILLEDEPAWPRFLKEVREFLGVQVAEEQEAALQAIEGDGHGASHATNHRWQEVSRLFNEAVEMAATEREAWLSRECAGDSELRREVEALLKSDERAELFTKIDEGVRGAILSWSADSEKQPGQSISHYDVIEKLGEGGMGMIYKARDRKLNRLAALKLLPHYLSSNPDMKHRFIQEARAAASLDHANICTIYEVGEVSGQLYIAMPYYEGETLKEKIEQGPLPVGDALYYARQIAEGLSHAHEAGIVHRDIKPANVMVTARGGVKILDFGIAKVSDAALTKSGTLLGTVAYMSPQQARGGVVDHRTDLWSLGVVLYEMLTGRQPFTGDSSYALLHSIQYEEPVSVRRLYPLIPESAEGLVRRLMHKEPEGRYRDANDLIAAMREIQRGVPRQHASPLQSDDGTRLVRRGTTGERALAAPTRVFEYETAADNQAQTAFPSTRSRSRRSVRKAITTLAVLPLANASDDPNMEYLSDGITENIINALSALPKLRVMARSVVFRYKGQDVDPIQTGRSLGVRAVLTGRVLHVGEQLIVGAELVDVMDGSQLWGEHYNRQFADIFHVQEEIASEITLKLQLRLSGDQKKRLTKRYTDNIEAYQLYLQGRYHWNRRTSEGVKNGIIYFRQAIELDSNFALAYSGLADCYIMSGFYDYLPPAEAFPQAKAAALKALELDDELAEAHISLAAIRTFYEWDWLDAERDFKQGLKLNDKSVKGHHWYACSLTSQARLEEGFGEMKQAQGLEPLSLIINRDVGRHYYFLRQYDQTIEHCLKTLEMDPGFFLAHFYLIPAYEQKGMFDEAIKELQRAIELSRGSAAMTALLGHVYGVSGQREKALKVLEELKERAEREYVPSFYFVLIYLGLDDRDEALKWLERAYQDRSTHLVWLKVDPIFDSLRTNPRFTELMRRMGMQA
jgi:serine/threonine protein kinase/pimeloyl-ACP methyl ester carboxylesterase/tetratricopeptide (TPR) repeat protein